MSEKRGPRRGKLSQDKFLNEYQRMLVKAKSLATASVLTSMKRVEVREYKKGSKKSKSEPPTAPEYVCLVRARLGDHKVSTTVTAKDHVRFHKQLSALLKVHADGLLAKSELHKRQSKAAIKAASKKRDTERSAADKAAAASKPKPKKKPFDPATAAAPKAKASTGKGKGSAKDKVEGKVAGKGAGAGAAKS